VLVLLYRWQMALCDYFRWTPADVEALTWWQFETAVEFVEDARKAASRV